MSDSNKAVDIVDILQKLPTRAQIEEAIEAALERALVKVLPIEALLQLVRERAMQIVPATDTDGMPKLVRQSTMYDPSVPGELGYNPSPYDTIEEAAQHFLDSSREPTNRRRVHRLFWALVQEGKVDESPDGVIAFWWYTTKGMTAPGYDEPGHPAWTWRMFARASGEWPGT